METQCKGRASLSWFSFSSQQFTNLAHFQRFYVSPSKIISCYPYSHVSAPLHDVHKFQNFFEYFSFNYSASAKGVTLKNVEYCKD